LESIILENFEDNKFNGLFPYQEKILNHLSIEMIDFIAGAQYFAL